MNYAIIVKLSLFIKKFGNNLMEFSPKLHEKIFFGLGHLSLRTFLRGFPSPDILIDFILIRKRLVIYCQNMISRFKAAIVD